MQPQNSYTAGSTNPQVQPAQLHKLATVIQRSSLSRSTLYREIKAGRLIVCRIGKSVRVREQDLIAFMDALLSA